MKHRSYLKLIGIFIIGFVAFTSCTTDDEMIVFGTDSIVNKWWYDSNNFTADVYFHSTGEFEQKILIGSTEYTAMADWIWEDENSGIIKISNLEGQGQLLQSLWVKVSDIQEHTITFQQSADGIDYSFEIFYKDTDD